jgi:hypothetical protein
MELLLEEGAHALCGGYEGTTVLMKLFFHGGHHQRSYISDPEMDADVNACLKVVCSYAEVVARWLLQQHRLLRRKAQNTHML